MSTSVKTGRSKKVLYWLLIVLVLVIAAGSIYLSTLLPIITGYAAKNMGSAVFVSGRVPNEVDTTDLNFSFIKFTTEKIDFADSTVTSRFLWGHSKAVYRKGLGVTLLRNTTEKQLKSTGVVEIPKPCYNGDTIAWPLGDIVPDSALSNEREALKTLADKLVLDNGYGGNAFAFMVLHKGIPVAEAYKLQFTKDTRFLSWSMAKSVMNAFVGVMVKDGSIDIYKPTGLKEWENDERKNITINDLMRMQSGLKWNEDYGSRSDVNVMLFCKKDMASYVLNQEPAAPAGESWVYSSGSSNVISYILRKKMGNDSQYYSFPYLKLFYKI
jgi:hypothetical protein